MPRTVMVPDFGDSESWWQPVTIPAAGEEGYLTPAQRIERAIPGDPWAPVIAHEQAIAEYIDAHPMPGPDASHDAKADLDAATAMAAEAEPEMEPG